MYEGYICSCSSDIVDKYSAEICSMYDADRDKFDIFFRKYFSDLSCFKGSRFKVFEGCYANAVAAVFYIYANIKLKIVVRYSNLSGWLQSKKIHFQSFGRYVSVAYDVVENNYGHFRKYNLIRIEKTKKCVKTLLGRIKKPVLYDHIMYVMDTAPHYHKRVDPYTIAASYIMFYIGVIRGRSIRKVTVMMRLHTGSVLAYYFGKFRYTMIGKFGDDIDKIIDQSTDDNIMI